MYTSDTTVTYDNNTVTGTKTVGTLKVRAMTLEDIKRVTGLKSISHATYLDDEHYSKLFKLGANYWLASAYLGYGMWYVNGITAYVYYFNGGNYEYGIRPVISLKANVKALFRDINNAWKIEI